MFILELIIGHLILGGLLALIFGGSKARAKRKEGVLVLTYPLRLKFVLAIAVVSFSYMLEMMIGRARDGTHDHPETTWISLMAFGVLLLFVGMALIDMLFFKVEITPFAIKRFSIFFGSKDIQISSISEWEFIEKKQLFIIRSLPKDKLRVSNRLAGISDLRALLESRCQSAKSG